jgi:hypothetical protein
VSLEQHHHIGSPSLIVSMSREVLAVFNFYFTSFYKVDKVDARPSLNRESGNGNWRRVLDVDGTYQVFQYLELENFGLKEGGQSKEMKLQNTLLQYDLKELDNEADRKRKEDEQFAYETAKATLESKKAENKRLEDQEIAAFELWLTQRSFMSGLNGQGFSRVEQVKMYLSHLSDRGQTAKRLQFYEAVNRLKPPPKQN